MNKDGREYSPKEIKILDAAASLIAEKPSSISSLKVADIAASAGIGKSTVYEYFSSKDEILREAIIRYVTMRIEEEWERAFARPTFKECVYCAMEEMFESADGFCIWDIQLLSALERSSAEKVFLHIKEFCLVRMTEMCSQLLIRGVEEGLFPMPPVEKAGQAFVHLFGGFSLIMRMGDRENYKKYMDLGYGMLIRALQ